MNANKSVIFLVGLAILAIIANMATFTVDQRESKIVTRFGEIIRTESEPGLKFKIPFIDETVSIDKRLIAFEHTGKTVQVNDSKFYLVDAFTVMRIDSPRRFRESVAASELTAERRIETRLDAALRDVYGSRSFTEVLSKARLEMMHEIATSIRPGADELGMSIEDVRIRRTDLLDDVLDRTYDRMKSERLEEAEKLRARGIESRGRIRAEADRRAIVLLAEANKNSEILRGEGDAERNRIFASAFNLDPEFFAFYRSMEAYEKALDSEGTTMVLSPNSEFFEYFGSGGTKK